MSDTTHDAWCVAAPAIFVALHFKWNGSVSVFRPSEWAITVMIEEWGNEWAKRRRGRGLTNEIKLHKTCQWCQLLSISQVHYGTATQHTAFSSVGSNSSHSSTVSFKSQVSVYSGVLIDIWVARTWTAAFILVPRRVVLLWWAIIGRSQ